jgi:hypothetical protein
MPEDLCGEAWQHLQKANAQLQRGQYTEALATLTTAEQLARNAPVLCLTDCKKALFLPI